MSSNSQPGRNSNNALNSGSKHQVSYGSVRSVTSTDPANYDDGLLLLDSNSDEQSQHQDDSHQAYSFNNAGASLRSLSQHAASIRLSMSKSMREFVDVGLVPDGSLNVSIRKFEGGATVTSEVANVAKNLIGRWV